MDDILTSLNWLTSQTSAAPMVDPPTPPTTPTPTQITEAPKVPSVVAAKEESDVDYHHNSAKPPYSYAQLITLAMTAQGGRKVLLTEIYDWIKTNFAHFRGADTSWQNSIRHNLSLNKQFIKVARGPNDKGKGSYWLLDPTNSFSKDPYCIRRRSFPPENRIQKPKPAVTHPCINPAVKLFLANPAKFDTPAAKRPKLFAIPSSNNQPEQKSQSRPNRPQRVRKGKPVVNSRSSVRSPTSTVSPDDTTVDSLGAQECVYTGHIPSFEDFNQKLFKKEVERFVLDPEGYNPQGDSECERVQVEYNWDQYVDYTQGVWPQGVQLPLHAETFGSVGLSPTTTDESENSRIPTPDWWKQSVNESQQPSYASLLPDSQFSPGTVFPLARVFVDTLNSPLGGPPSTLDPSAPHPWSEQPPPGIFPEPTGPPGLTDLDYSNRSAPTADRQSL